MYYYAQIDQSGVCYAISELNAEVLSDNLIRIDSYDETFLNRQYINGEWVLLPVQESQSAPVVTNEELMKATMDVRAMMDVLLVKGATSEPDRLEGSTKDDAHLEQYNFWQESYSKDYVSANTLQRLADGGVLSQKEVDGIKLERISRFGV